MALDRTSPSYDCTTPHHMPQCQTQGPRARGKVESTVEVSKFRTPVIQMSKQLPQSHHRVTYDRVRPSSILVVKASSKAKIMQCLSCTWSRVPVAFLIFRDLSTILDNVIKHQHTLLLCKSLGHLFRDFHEPLEQFWNDETLRGWSSACFESAKRACSSLIQWAKV